MRSARSATSTFGVGDDLSAEAAAGTLLRFRLRLRLASAPTTAPQKPATSDAIGPRFTRSAATETAQKPTRLSPATFQIPHFSIFILDAIE